MLIKSKGLLTPTRRGLLRLGAKGLIVLAAPAIIRPDALWAQVAQTGGGVAKPASGGGGSNNIAFDNDFSDVTNATSITVSFPALSANDFIVIACEYNGGPLSSLTNTLGLTLSPRVAANNSSTICLQVWTGVTPSAISSGSVTFTQSVAGFIYLGIAGFSGVNTTTKFDSNGSVPVGVTSADPQNITTSNANDMLVAFFRAGVSGPTAGSGWTSFPHMTGGNFFQGQYKPTTASGTYSATLTTGSGLSSAVIVDAYVSS